jgi:hypothetical protein
MTSSATYLQQLVHETHKSEAEVIALAVQAGLRQLWREQLLGQYLQGRVSRELAIEEVGIDWVDLAERQRQAVLEDMAWALTIPDRQ